MTEKPFGGPLADKVIWVREELDRQRAASKNAREQASPLRDEPAPLKPTGEPMPDVTTPEVPTAITDEPQSQAMQPVDDQAAVKKMTHEVDTDDMFDSTT